MPKKDCQIWCSTNIQSYSLERWKIQSLKWVTLCEYATYSQNSFWFVFRNKNLTTKFLTLLTFWWPWPQYLDMRLQKTSFYYEMHLLVLELLKKEKYFRFYKPLYVTLECIRHSWVLNSCTRWKLSETLLWSDLWSMTTITRN